jgi:hypothetical protein
MDQMHFTLLVSAIKCLMLFYYILNIHDKWVSVTASWHILKLPMEEQPPIRTAAANILNKQSQIADKAEPSSLAVR